MADYQTYDVHYMLDKKPHDAAMQVESFDRQGKTEYRAIITDSPLRGTYGGYASSVAEALDFLNLAMQAEGADEIHFTPRGEMRKAA
ncbi:MAG: hypothetical protein ACYDBB_22930 [Armatimonadota bacterium]